MPMPMPIAEAFVELVDEAPAETRKIIVDKDEAGYVEALHAGVDQILDRVEARLDAADEERERERARR